MQPGPYVRNESVKTKVSWIFTPPPPNLDETRVVGAGQQLKELKPKNLLKKERSRGRESPPAVNTELVEWSPWNFTFSSNFLFVQIGNPTPLPYSKKAISRESSQATCV